MKAPASVLLPLPVVSEGLVRNRWDPRVLSCVLGMLLFYFRPLQNISGPAPRPADLAVAHYIESAVTEPRKGLRVATVTPTHRPGRGRPAHAGSCRAPPTPARARAPPRPHRPTSPRRRPSLKTEDGGTAAPAQAPPPPTGPSGVGHAMRAAPPLDIPPAPPRRRRPLRRWPRPRPCPPPPPRPPRRASGRR